MKGLKAEEKRKMDENPGAGSPWEPNREADPATEQEAEDREREERSFSVGGRRRERKCLTGSMMAKIAAFFLLAGSALAGLGAMVFVAYMEIHEFYTADMDTILLSVMREEMRAETYIAEYYIREGKISQAIDMLWESNMDMAIIEEKNGQENVIWKTEREYESKLTIDTYITFDKTEKNVRLNGYSMEDEKIYLYRVWLNPEFPMADTFRNRAEWTELLYENRYMILGIAAAGFVLCLICFVFLMCSAGHRNGREGIVPGVLTGIPLDVLAALFFGAAVGSCAFLLGGFGRNNETVWMLLLVAEGVFLTVWLTLFFMDFAVRLKRGNCWRNSLIYMILRWFWHVLRFLCRGIMTLFRGVPQILTTMIAYGALCMLEMIGVLRYCVSEAVMLWAIEKVLLLPVIMYVALICDKFLTAGRALAEGDEDYRVNTAGMWGDFKEHGENLNSIGKGISRAVAERMKSERLKTELISNVSHDLKTPLTSIINYADLIYEETRQTALADAGGGGEESGARGLDQEKIEEYSEVLLRQSRRLKKLLEDLVDASKATTGNVEVNLESCEVGVLLSQAVGEYQQRMEERALEPVVRQPEKPVEIMADGRHLWRVFDNLLNNICKYAQEHSRVYLSVEEKEGQVLIIFRNMSKYPLDISAQELEERFVRGDKSRHMEGNGLGLSIAKSLVELQNGQMEIVIDGDLFKVSLCFPQKEI
jgi:signal transduction histidine kinase